MIHWVGLRTSLKFQSSNDHEILNLDFYSCISNLAIRISNFSNILCVWVSRKYRLWSTSLVDFGGKTRQVDIDTYITINSTFKSHCAKNLWIANMYLLHTACKYCRRRAKNKMNDECISRLQFFIDAYYSFCDMNIECVRNTVS